MTVNLDNTKALNRIADALEAINTTIKVKGGLEALTADLMEAIQKLRLRITHLQADGEDE